MRTVHVVFTNQIAWEGDSLKADIHVDEFGMWATIIDGDVYLNGPIRYYSVTAS